MARVIFLMLPTARILRLTALADWTAGIVPFLLLRELGLEFGDRLLELLLDVRLELLRLADLLADAGVALLEELEEPLLEGLHRRRGQVVQQARGAGVDDHDLALERQRAELVLFEELDQALAARQLVARVLVQVARELGESRQLPELRQVEAQLAGHLLHGARLGAAADARHADADV